jgi:hypothetical protein
MSKITDIVVRRRITEILHFSTNHGLTGILAEGAILPRRGLPKSKYIEHVYKPNARVRQDGPWLDYVNLSISRLNTTFFSRSTRWHEAEDVWWCALAFAPVVLDHKGVMFATTNNMYTGCHRRSGAEGLEALFAEKIEPWSGNTLCRPGGTSASWTTDLQAEVLYPGRLDCRYLQCLYVASGAHHDIAAATCEILLEPHRSGGLKGRRVPIVIAPQMFDA